jgi:hypothetical protein
MTDWTPYTPPSAAPSDLQCVTTWRGPVAGTYPLHVFWAGADGTLWQSTTDPHSKFVQMFTNTTAVTRMAVDDRETIYGIDSSGKPVQYGNDGWGSLDLGTGSTNKTMVGVAVAVDDDTVWFVAQEGQYYVHATNMNLEKELMLGFMAIAPMKSPDPSDVNSEGVAWGVLNWKILAYNSGNAWVYNDGKNNMVSDVVDVSTSVDYAWLIKTDGSVWATETGYYAKRAGTLTVKSICGGQGDYCFAVGADGKPYRTTDPNPLA